MVESGSCNEYFNLCLDSYLNSELLCHNLGVRFVLSSFKIMMSEAGSDKQLLVVESASGPCNEYFDLCL